VTPPLDVVTGAYGYTGRYLTRRLLEAGRSVRTLTANPSRPDLFGGRVEAFPFSFDDPGRLAETLDGAETLYNTYWVRFPYRDVGYERESGTSFAIVRPTLVFGREDILVNNIAWILRRLPVFAVPGDGRYRVQPVYVEDVARLCVDLGSSRDAVTLDAAGPETYTFDELVGLVRDSVGSRARIVHAPPRVAFALGSVIGAPSATSSSHARSSRA
jgi:nucleoside-diphosphate-sugar epimerase